jgi:hypothetical protein
MKVKQAPFYHSCICQYEISRFIKIIFRKFHFLVLNLIIYNIPKQLTMIVLLVLDDVH